MPAGFREASLENGRNTVTKIIQNRARLQGEAWLACRYMGGMSCTLFRAQIIRGIELRLGRVQQYKTLLSDLELFQQPRSLLRMAEAISLPVTIRDAMGLVQALGERFLWVDSLCIIEDAPQHKHSELDKMSGIYANASVTIIAAQGSDASYGLRGLKGVSKPRPLQQVVYSLGKAQLAERSFHLINAKPAFGEREDGHFKSLFSPGEGLSLKQIVYDGSVERPDF